MDMREHPDVIAFQQAAERFCGLLEMKPADALRWVENILAALAKMYACGHALPLLGVSDDVDTPSAFNVSDDEWKQVFQLTHSVLGVQTYYWAYDPSEPIDSQQAPGVGDVGDDLADIYCDVKPGLRAWENRVDAYLPSVIFDWKFPSFGSHWGVHAVSAMQALHPIVFLRGLHEES